MSNETDKPTKPDRCVADYVYLLIGTGAAVIGLIPLATFLWLAIYGHYDLRILGMSVFLVGSGIAIAIWGDAWNSWVSKVCKAERNEGS